MPRDNEAPLLTGRQPGCGCSPTAVVRGRSCRRRSGGRALAKPLSRPWGITRTGRASAPMGRGAGLRLDGAAPAPEEGPGASRRKAPAWLQSAVGRFLLRRVAGSACLRQNPRKTAFGPGSERPRTCSASSPARVFRHRPAQEAAISWRCCLLRFMKDRSRCRGNAPPWPHPPLPAHRAFRLETHRAFLRPVALPCMENRRTGQRIRHSRKDRS